MASTATSQVPTGSLDTAGISISTATPTADNVRAGTIYNPALLAAAQSVWFHPLFDGRYLMVNSRTWSAGTPAGGIGYFSGYTESLDPSWLIVDGPSGAIAPVPNFPVIPFRNSPDTAQVTAAASRPPNYLFLLHQVSINDTVAAILQIMNITTSGAVTIAGEEILPTVAIDSDSVLFDRGVQFTNPYLTVYGCDSANVVYAMRKPWAKIGTTPSIDPARIDPTTQFQAVGLSKLANVVTPLPTTINPSPQTHAGIGATQVAWEYYSGAGYTSDSTHLAPITTSSGTSLTTTGPMSFAMVGNRWVFSTVATSGSTITAQLWSSRSGRPLMPMGSPVALGSTSSGTYLGGGLQLQPQLKVAAVPSGAKAALLYVVSTKLSASGNFSLANTWGTIPVGV